ncbi:MAG TPA: squalene synthase HpnC, partial [Bryobacteraceae bacterium]|nr:squalene synthase HpnC [Bryobacteraceae bacterium]
MFLAPREFVASPEALAWSCSAQEAGEYTRWLSTHHYENFHVVTFLLPRRLRQDFYNVYAFCRWADDLGDEIGDPRESLRLLEWWRGELDAMYSGRATHPVFVALAGTVERHDLPKQPFADLIQAFIQDQRVARYATWDDLFEYCRFSANPVGRLVLYLCGYRDAARQELSDATCTALQLANFWQDVSVDLRKGRIYLPLELMEKHGYSAADLEAGLENAAFRNVIREAVDVARKLFHQGLPLAGMVNGRLSVDLELFSRGGLRILEKIELQDGDVLASRPHI